MARETVSPPLTHGAPSGARSQGVSEAAHGGPEAQGRPGLVLIAEQVGARCRTRPPALPAGPLLTESQQPPCRRGLDMRDTESPEPPSGSWAAQLPSRRASVAERNARSRGAASTPSHALGWGGHPPRERGAGELPRIPRPGRTTSQVALLRNREVLISRSAACLRREVLNNY